MDSSIVNRKPVHIFDSGLGRVIRLLNSSVPGFGREAVTRLFNSPDVKPGDLRSTVCSTHPVSVPKNEGSLVFTSTRLPSHPPTAHIPANSLSATPDMSIPALSDLITHIAHQVGRSISAQLRGESQTNEGSQVRVQNPGTGQSLVDSTLNLTGVKLVMQSDVREPPVYRGDGSDKLSVHEWEELMDSYLRKRSKKLGEQHQEMLSRLMGKAKDIVRIMLPTHH